MLVYGPDADKDDIFSFKKVAYRMVDERSDFYCMSIISILEKFLISFPRYGHAVKWRIGKRTDRFWPLSL